MQWQTMKPRIALQCADDGMGKRKQVHRILNRRGPRHWILCATILSTLGSICQASEDENVRNQLRQRGLMQAHNRNAMLDWIIDGTTTNKIIDFYVHPKEDIMMQLSQDQMQ